MTTSAAVRERPILFAGRLVRAILEGRKTVTRRVVKPQPEQRGALHGEPMWHWSSPRYDNGDGVHYFHTGEEAAKRLMVGACPFGVPGDRLWVRETWGAWHERTYYRANDDFLEGRAPMRWRPSIHMPRWASRINLEVTGVGVERLQKINEHQAHAEGVEDAPEEYPMWGMGGGTPAEARAQDTWVAKYGRWYRDHFRATWDELNARRGYGWDANPWVWVIEFRRVDASNG